MYYSVIILERYNKTGTFSRYCGKRYKKSIILKLFEKGTTKQVLFSSKLQTVFGHRHYYSRKEQQNMYYFAKNIYQNRNNFTTLCENNYKKMHRNDCAVCDESTSKWILFHDSVKEVRQTVKMQLFWSHKKSFFGRRKRVL